MKLPALVPRSSRRPLRLLCLWLCLTPVVGSHSRALPEDLGLEPAPPGAGQPAAPETSDDPGEVSTLPSIASSLPNPDPGRIRASLGERGITYSLTYIGETLGNVSGGTRRGAVYQGLLDAQIDVDLERLVGLPGLSLHADAYQAHGRGLSRYHLGDNFLIASGIETRPATRLYELWLEQELWDGRVAVRAGRLGAWQVHVLDLASGAETPIPGTSGVDDQVAWLDDATLAYARVTESGRPPSIFSSPADGSGEPALLVAEASSPAPTG